MPGDFQFHPPSDMNSAKPDKAPINWPAAVTLWSTLFSALILIPVYAHSNEFSTAAWVSFIVLSGLNGISITAGYHRLWSHRAYSAHPVVRFFLLAFGTMAVQNSVYIWASGHRRHHRHVDHVDNDPYSAKRGFWFSHMGWMVREYSTNKEDFSNIPDLLEDRMLAFQHKHYTVLALGINFGLPFLIGYLCGDVWGVVLLGGLLRLVWSHHTTFFINSLAHIWGKRPYTDANSARDNGILALFTYGEGYHNYHHIFQYDYRNGIRWYQFDPTKWLIRGLAFCGLAGELKRVPNFKIEKARLDMQFKRAEQNLSCKKLAALDSIEQLKATLAREYESFSAALQEWAKVKEEQIQAAREAFEHSDMMAACHARLAAIEASLKAQRKRVAALLEEIPRSRKTEFASTL